MKMVGHRPYMVAKFLYRRRYPVADLIEAYAGGCDSLHRKIQEKMFISLRKEAGSAVAAASSS